MTNLTSLIGRGVVLGGSLMAVAIIAKSHVEAQTKLARGTVTFPDVTKVVVEIAADQQTRNRGLMCRTALGENEGMIFVFEKEDLYPFWMKNTLIPLDMIWVDRTGRIASIAHSVQPCKADPCPNIPPDRDASYVVEVVAGFARKHSLKVGDQLKMEGIPTPEVVEKGWNGPKVDGPAPTTCP